MTLRRLLIGLAVAAIAVPATAYATLTRDSGPSVQKKADLYDIEQIEVKWHRAHSTKNLKLGMSVWAPNATFTVGSKTYTGKAAIRRVFEKVAPYQPQNHWISETPAYKSRATVDGNKGTLYFECHYVDVDTGKVVSVIGAINDVKKINGKWLVVHSSAATPTLKP
jgi:hypothetical protein